MNQTQSRNWILFCSLVAICCLLWSIKGVRGTDQYWYLSDTATLATHGETLSNTYYPGVLLRNLPLATDTPNHFIHNGPMLHLASALGGSDNTYFAWIAINIFCHLFVALTIYIAAKRYTDTTTSTISCCLYLLSPIALWQSMNMLQEQSHAGIMAAYLLFYLFREYRFVLLIAAAIQIIGTLSHPIFLVLSICFNIFLITSGLLHKRTAPVMAGLLTGALCLLAKSYSHDIFPSSFQPNLAAIVAGAVPGKTNLLWQLAEVPPVITTELMVAKFKAASTGTSLILEMLRSISTPIFRCWHSLLPLLLRQKNMQKYLFRLP